MNLSSRSVLAVLVVVCAMRVAPAQDADASRKAIDRLLDQYHEAGQLNGAVLVARDGVAVYSRAFGLANREWAVPNTTDTRFAVGSITKTFTAIVCLRLVERGRLKLDGTIRDYLPDYAGEGADKITLRHLLTHTSGLERDIGDFPVEGNRFPPLVSQINADHFSLDEQVALIAKRPLLYAPGARPDYSSNGYAVLGAIASRVSKTPFAEVLRAELFVPAGMTESGYVPQTVVVPRRATGYRQTFAGYEIGRPLGLSPAGGAYSTVGDLGKLDTALHGDKLLSAGSKAIAWAPSASVTAYGWKVRERKSAAGTDRYVEASGSLPGFYSLFTRLETGKLSVVVLSNVHDLKFKLDEITWGIVAVLRGEQAPPPRRSAALRLGLRVEQAGFEAAWGEFQSDRASKSPVYHIDEAEMNSLGYHLLAQEQNRGAVVVLKLNAELFPTSWNAFDSLGEVCAVVGDTEGAIRGYERSVELNPKNDNGIAMLKKLRAAKGK